jgi:hypothetical protein
MMRLLQWLFVGHVHKWKNLTRHNVVNKRGKVTGEAYVQQCEQCGVVTRRDLT